MRAAQSFGRWALCYCGLCTSSQLIQFGRNLSSLYWTKCQILFPNPKYIIPTGERRMYLVWKIGYYTCSSPWTEGPWTVPANYNWILPTTAGSLHQVAGPEGWKSSLQTLLSNSLLATNVTLHRHGKAIWGHSWKDSSERSLTNAASVTSWLNQVVLSNLHLADYNFAYYWECQLPDLRCKLKARTQMCVRGYWLDPSIMSFFTPVCKINFSIIKLTYESKYLPKEHLGGSDIVKTRHLVNGQKRMTFLTPANELASQWVSHS